MRFCRRRKTELDAGFRMILKDSGFACSVRVF
jgi:hypothetical protein